MRLLLAVAWSCIITTHAHAQLARVVVTPIAFDTTDRRLASELRNALAGAQPRARVIAKDWTEAMFQIGPDLLAVTGLYEVGRMLRADWVIGVHACRAPVACVTVISTRVKWPVVADTVTMHGAAWVDATVDSLTPRLPQRPPGS